MILLSRNLITQIHPFPELKFNMWVKLITFINLMYQSKASVNSRQFCGKNLYKNQLTKLLKESQSQIGDEKSIQKFATTGSCFYSQDRRTILGGVDRIQEMNLSGRLQNQNKGCSHKQGSLRPNQYQKERKKCDLPSRCLPLIVQCIFQKNLTGSWGKSWRDVGSALFVIPEYRH